MQCLAHSRCSRKFGAIAEDNSQCSGQFLSSTWHRGSDIGFLAPWEPGTQTPDQGRPSLRKHECSLDISLPLSPRYSLCFEGAGRGRDAHRWERRPQVIHPPWPPPGRCTALGASGPGGHTPGPARREGGCISLAQGVWNSRARVAEEGPGPPEGIWPPCMGSPDS